MELIFGALLIFVALLGRLISSLLTDELKAWTPSIVACLIKSAVLHLRQEDRERFAEEWQSHVSDVPGNLAKLYVALGFLGASRRMTLNPELDIGYIFTKRTIDLFLSATGLAILSPLFLLAVAIIKLGSNGPIFILNTRWGYGGRPIRLCHFRIHRVDSEEYVPFGRFLALVGPLPKLLDVMFGEMSLVGPRPRPLSPGC